MPNAAADFPVVDLHGDFFNLIPSRSPSVDLFERIASGRDTEVAEIENATNPRIRAEGRLTAESPYAVDERPPKLQNWNLAPFSYPNPEGSVLFDRTVQCLELSGDIQTALAASVAKRERFLRRTCEGPIGLDMRMLKRAVMVGSWTPGWRRPPWTGAGSGNLGSRYFEPPGKRNVMA